VKPLTALVLVLAFLFSGGCRGSSEVGGTPAGSPAGSPAPTLTARQEQSYFAAFWPAATLAEAQALQREVDRGREPWRIDPREVAKTYAREAAHWEVRVLSSEISGSQQAGWTASVVFQPLIGEGQPPNFPGPRHTMKLIGLDRVARPAWFVSSLRTEEVVVTSPSEAEVLSSPLRLAGRGRAFEGTVHVRVLDDNGVQLYPRAGEPGIIPVEAGAIEPFQASIPLQDPSAGAGVLILTADAGTGPVPAIVVFKVRFPRNESPA
jgi:hypothetical protein